MSFQRRLRNGLSFGFNDVIGFYDRQNLAPRLQHADDGTFRCAPIRRKRKNCSAATIHART